MNFPVIPTVLGNTLISRLIDNPDRGVRKKLENNNPGEASDK